MTKEQLAAMLDGRQYGDEITLEEIRTAGNNRLVVVSGTSDDMMDFAGFINDEIRCFGGGIAYLADSGFWESRCDDDECPYAQEEQEQCFKIRAIWHEEGDPCWTYETDIPHATFNIYEGKELYCAGIVFSAHDIKGYRQKGAGKMTNFEKWKQDLKPNDLLYNDYHAGALFSALILSCSICPVVSCPRKIPNNLIRDDICEENYLEWANGRSEVEEND
jgi:hypothetical protein